VNLFTNIHITESLGGTIRGAFFFAMSMPFAVASQPNTSTVPNCEPFLAVFTAKGNALRGEQLNLQVFWDL
jgi:hypothetical protein